jgi:hypothetical protein
VKTLSLGVETFDVGLLVPMSDHEFSDFLKRDSVGLTPVV